MKQKGFTLIELLIVIAVIAIIAAVAFVALDPLTRFQDARDSTRWTDASAVLDAIKVDQVDNKGSYASDVPASGASIYMLGSCAAGATGAAVTDNCTTNPTVAACLDLTAGSDDIVSEGYIGSIPVSPNGSGTWGAATTGYTLEHRTGGIIAIRACEGEGGTEISVSR